MISYVYFIKNTLTNHYKIGVSSDVANRLLTLQTANSSPLILVSCIPYSSRIEAFDAEAKFHHEFRKHRLSGEWFSDIKFKGSALSISEDISRQEIERDLVSSKEKTRKRFQQLRDRIKSLESQIVDLKAELE